MISYILYLIEGQLQNIWRNSSNLQAKTYRAKKIFENVFFITYGSFIGLLFYHFFLNNLGLPKYYKMIFSSLSSFLFGVMCLNFKQFRCIFILIWIKILSSTGKNLINALIITILLTGPMQNLIGNSLELVRMFECTSYLKYNLTRNKMDLGLLPLTKAFINASQNISQIQEQFNEIRILLNPIIKEIEKNGFSDW
jgi:hypothetical protein